MLVTFLTAVLFSNTLIAEFLTDYVFLSEPIDGSKTRITIYNKGGFQASNVLVSFLANSTAKMTYSNCPEGTIYLPENNGEPITIDIPRMTPGYFCTYHFENNLDVQNIRITSENRMTVWKDGKSSYNPLVSELTLVGVFVLYGVMMFYVIRLPWKTLENWLWLKISRNKFTASDNNKEIREFVKKEYRTTINDKDAGIIEAIFCGKDTFRQILSYTMLPNAYVKQRLEQLKENDLIKMNPITLDDTLQNHMKSLGKITTKIK
jgi:hypothetical protein